MQKKREINERELFCGGGWGGIGSDGIWKRREKRGRGEGKVARGMSKWKKEKKGGVADKPSGSALSLWTACFRGQQKISWHLARKGDPLLLISAEWMESCRNIMYSWVPGAASSWTAVVPQQNEVGVRELGTVTHVKSKKNNNNNKEKGKNTSKSKQHERK